MKKRPEKSGRRPRLSLRYVNVVDGGIHYLFYYLPTSFGTHLREQNHVADGLRIGQQHYQAVDADAATACRRQTEFHRADVVGIVVHGFVVARIFLRHL